MKGAEPLPHESPDELPNRPVWESGSWRSLPSLRGEVRADLCVVGLGGSGLAAVTEGVRRGLSVVGLDAGAVAGRAAGRNGGFLLAGLAPFHHEAVAALGRQRAAELYRETLAELARMRAYTPTVVRRTGSLRIADDAEEMEDCRHQYLAMRTDELPVERYHGAEGDGLYFPLDCVFNPLERCRRLAEDALAQGATLYEESPVTDFDAGSVRTAAGSVSAGAVIVAIDGGLETLVPELAGRTKTARLQMLATAPLPKRLYDLPVYRRHGYEYFQQLPDRSLALGGFRDRGGEGEWTADTTPAEPVQGLLERFLREELRIAEPITHRWAASVGFSAGSLPVFASVRGGAVAIGGYSGTGNVVGSLTGRSSVAAVLGESSYLAELLGYEGATA